jgi:hypothetical protein
MRHVMNAIETKHAGGPEAYDAELLGLTAEVWRRTGSER